MLSLDLPNVIRLWGVVCLGLRMPQEHFLQFDAGIQGVKSEGRCMRLETSPGEATV